MGDIFEPKIPSTDDLRFLNDIDKFHEAIRKAVTPLMDKGYPETFAAWLLKQHAYGAVLPGRLAARVAIHVDDGHRHDDGTVNDECRDELAKLFADAGLISAADRKLLASRLSDTRTQIGRTFEDMSKIGDPYKLSSSAPPDEVPVRLDDAIAGLEKLLIERRAHLARLQTRDPPPADSREWEWNRIEVSCVAAQCADIHQANLLLQRLRDLCPEVAFLDILPSRGPFSRNRSTTAKSANDNAIEASATESDVSHEP